MAPAPAEIDVFSGPHSRIKHLVNLYSNRLDVTDFSNESDLKSFLWSLRLTFKEFRTHEKIENECIMDKLKRRLSYHKVCIQEVTEVHSDDCLGKMARLLEDGCNQTAMCQSAAEMEKIGTQLANALRKFTAGFLPHMKEEEEFFQPLLMKYFTYEELKEIRQKVLTEHCLLTNLEKEDLEVEVKDKMEEELLPSKIQLLPSEIMVKIFSYMNPQDLSRCAQVCSQWDVIAKDPTLWKELHPAQWAQGDWRIHIPAEEVEEIAETSQIINEMKEFKIDDDADIDESESSEESDAEISSKRRSAFERVRREARVLSDIAKYLLPVVGTGVQRINLAGSQAVTNGLVYKFLQLCPNVQSLNLAQTKISDSAFKGLPRHGSFHKLKYLNLSGCSGVTDRSIVNFAKALRNKSAKNETILPIIQKLSKHQLDKNGKPKLSLEYDCTQERKMTTRNKPFCPRCSCGKSSVKEFASGTDNDWVWPIVSQPGKLIDTESVSVKDGERTLQYLSLSGCYRITDFGLRNLAYQQTFPRLKHLDLSGCSNVSAEGLENFVKACPALNHEEFFYCDNILEGPYAATASGCQNLGCGNRVCCRGGD